MSNIWETLDLVARWIHVIAGIMWVGNSLLFNWLDRSLVKTPAAGQTSRPVGTIWLLHSGGFYYVEKTLLDNERMPGRVHWFMWQAYTTWISGALLLIIVYYAGGRAVLADPSVADIPHWQAVLIGVGGIVIGRSIYESMQRVPSAVGTGIWLVALTAIAIAFTQLLNGRAAFLHVGAMLATIMAGNVGRTIVPSQRALVAAVEGGQSSQELSDRAKRVSIHNNYFTFPVIALMLISHFPAVYGHHWNWLLLLLLVAGGAAARHALNVRWTSSSWKPMLAGSIAATVIPIWALLNVTPRSASTAGSFPVSGGTPPFEDVRHVIDRRCGVCHSDRPTDISLGRTPAGVKFDTPQEILMHAQRIHARAVVTKTMPPANKTDITEAERALIGRWFTAGSPVE